MAHNKPKTPKLLQTGLKRAVLYVCVLGNKYI